MNKDQFKISYQDRKQCNGSNGSRQTSDLGSILGRVIFLINLIMKISQVSATFPGCGQSGKLPNCEYRVKLQYEYLSALLDKLNLPQKVMFC